MHRLPPILIENLFPQILSEKYAIRKTRGHKNVECDWELGVGFFFNNTSQWRIQDFPEEGTPTPRGAPTYDFAKFSQKLHEIERIWTGGGARPSRPLRSATASFGQNSKKEHFFYSG